MGKLKYNPVKTGFTKEHIQDILSRPCENEVPVVHCKYSDIVREFKKSGKYANFDYNSGGIQQLVKDFENGKIYDGMFEENE